MFVDTCLPAGSLGLELEPAVKTSRCSIGCKVRRWRTESPFSSLILPGHIFIEIDDMNVETAEFKDIVQLLKSSLSRKVVMKSLMHQPSSMPSHKMATSCFTSNATDSFEQRRNPSRISLCKELFNHPTSDFQSQQVADENIANNQDKSLFHVDNMHLQEADEVTRLKNDIVALKSNVRASDGVIALLKFRMEKLRAEPRGNDTKVNLLQYMIVHWGKMRYILNEIGSSGHDNNCKNCIHEKVDDLKKCLNIEKQYSNRLHAQMRCWVDGQLALHKHLAVMDVCAVTDAQTDAKIDILSDKQAERTMFIDKSATESGELVDSACLKTRKATPILQKLLQRNDLEKENQVVSKVSSSFMCKVFGSSEKKSNMEVNIEMKSKRYSLRSDIIFASENTQMSQVTFREELSRLQKENSMIRDDISKFRGTLSVLFFITTINNIFQ